MRLQHPPAGLEAFGLNSTRKLLPGAGDKTLVAEDHRVLSLPGLDIQAFRSNHYAGYLSIDRQTDSNIFYWLFDAEGGPVGKPLLIWLNGGPGCSSMDGLFLEVGPFRVNGDQININPHSWHRHANVLFIDQPVGTGFSFTKGRNSYPTTYSEVSEQFYSFLLKFFRLHSRFLTPNDPKRTIPIYISGNSLYVPSMMRSMLFR